VTKEFLVTIEHNGKGNAEKSHHLVEVQIGHMSCIIWLMVKEEVRHLRKLIDHHHD